MFKEVRVGGGALLSGDLYFGRKLIDIPVCREDALRGNLLTNTDFASIIVFN